MYMYTGCSTSFYERKRKKNKSEQLGATSSVVENESNIICTGYVNSCMVGRDNKPSFFD